MSLPKKLLLGLAVSSVIYIASVTVPAALSTSDNPELRVVSSQLVSPAYAQLELLNPLNGILSAINAIRDRLTSGLAGLVEEIIKFILQTIVKILRGNPSASALGPPTTIGQAYEQYGALGAVGLTVQDMYNHPPYSSSDFLATINPINQAHAQSSGNQALTPLLAFWEIMRNLAYTFFVLILVAIGLMVMLRSKIDPRTTVTVTAALPNLILSLILITFSLALAGFLIDFGRVIQNLVIGVLQGVIPTGQGARLDFGSIFSGFVLNANNAVNLGAGAPPIAEGFIQVVISVFAFIIGIQILVILLLRYVNLIVKPIFAPFTFLFGALPGRGENTVAWFKSYLVDVLTFPGVLLMINLAWFVKNNPEGRAIVSNDPFGVFAGQGVNFNSIVAIAVLFLATKVPAILEDALDVKPSSHVERAGAQPQSMAKQIPILKNFL